MFSKTSILITAFAVAQLASAQTPACLLAAVNTYQNPADVKSICGQSSQINNQLNSMCGPNAAAAKQAFDAMCANKGVSVTISGPAPSSTTSGTSTGSASSATTTGTSTGSATGSGASATSSHGSADNIHLGSFSAGAIALAGLALAL